MEKSVSISVDFDYLYDPLIYRNLIHIFPNIQLNFLREKNTLSFNIPINFSEDFIRKLLKKLIFMCPADLENDFITFIAFRNCNIDALLINNVCFKPLSINIKSMYNFYIERDNLLSKKATKYSNIYDKLIEINNLTLYNTKSIYNSSDVYWWFNMPKFIDFFNKDDQTPYITFPNNINVSSLTCKKIIKNRTISIECWTKKQYYEYKKMFNL